MPLAAFHLLQLQQKRGRLPNGEKEKLTTHIIKDIEQSAASFTVDECYTSSICYSRIPIKGELDVDHYLALPPPRAHHPYPIRTFTVIQPNLIILFDASASLDVKQRYVALIMLCVLLHQFPDSMVLAFSTHTHTMKPRTKTMSFSALFKDINDIKPAYTHLKEAIRTAVSQQRSARDIIILFSDAASNYGIAPTNTDFRGSMCILFALTQQALKEGQRLIPAQNIIPLYREEMIAMACVKLGDYIKDSFSQHNIPAHL